MGLGSLARFLAIPLLHPLVMFILLTIADQQLSDLPLCLLRPFLRLLKLPLRWLRVRLLGRATKDALTDGLVLSVGEPLFADASLFFVHGSRCQPRCCDIYPHHARPPSVTSDVMLCYIWTRATGSTGLGLQGWPSNLYNPRTHAPSLSARIS